MLQNIRKNDMVKVWGKVTKRYDKYSINLSEEEDVVEITKKEDFMIDLFFYTIPISLIGARLYFVLFHLSRLVLFSFLSSLFSLIV